MAKTIHCKKKKKKKILTKEIILKIISNYPIWGMIYYSLRCGFIELALEISQSSSISENFQTALKLLSKDSKKKKYKINQILFFFF